MRRRIERRSVLPGQQVLRRDVGHAEVREVGLAVVGESQHAPRVTVGGRREHPVEEDVRERPGQEASEQVAELTRGRVSAVGDAIAVDVDLLGERVEAVVVDATPDRLVTDDRDIDGSVVADVVVDDLDAVGREDHDPGAGWHRADDVSRRCEVRRVVVVDTVAADEHVAAVDDLQTGQVEDEDAAGVASRGAADDFRVGGVLDLDARDVQFRPRIPHQHEIRLPDVDARVAGADRDAFVDEHVAALDGIDAVRAVAGIGPAGPLGADSSEHDAVAAEHLDRVARGVLDREILDDEGVAGRDEPLTADLLPRETQDRLVEALTADRQVIGGRTEFGGESEDAGPEFDDVTRTRRDQRLLQAVWRVGTGIDASVLRVRGGGNQHHGGGESSDLRHVVWLRSPGVLDAV